MMRRWIAAIEELMIGGAVCQANQTSNVMKEGVLPSPVRAVMHVRPAFISYCIDWPTSGAIESFASLP